ncbi:MAG: hypothetical protein WD648_14830 [Planctomycetaceae bacterium]
MQKITRNVRDLEKEERRVFEAALGEKLRENQQVIMEVVTVEAPEQRIEAGAARQADTGLPDWCNVYEGLSDDEVAEIEKTILDRSGWNRRSQ